MNRGQDSPNLSPSWRPSCAAQLHALPVELLAHIFTFCTEAPDSPPLPYPAWLPITHVCHHWRTISLNHAPLWASITCGLSLRWVKVFMERSRTLLMDFDIRVDPLWAYTRNHNVGLYHDDIIQILADFTRVRSLHLTGSRRTILPIVDSLRSSLPIQSLSFCLHDHGKKFVLSDDLFGGKAPIRRLQFIGNGAIVAPHWLLRGVTHFTSTETMLSELLDVLRHMSTLTYFEFRPGYLSWRTSDVDKLRPSPIQMPQLRNLIVRPMGPTHSRLLNQLLLLRAGAKRRLELGAKRSYDWIVNEDCMHGLSSVVEAVNGFQHIHLSGGRKEGWFRMWTGGATTTWEDAEFCLCAEWTEVPKYQRYLHGNVSASHLIALCDVLGAARVHRLVINSTSLGMSKSYWWELLEKLPGIEELELYPTSVDALGSAWMENTAKRARKAPAVLPVLRKVRILTSEIDQPSHQYAIIGDITARRIVRLPNSTEGDITSSPEAVSAEKELGDMSSGLLRLLQGLGRDQKKGKEKKDGGDDGMVHTHTPN
ncbi:hypothetical protein EDB86DRAFT_2985916 [Lactarius hatsudake]|nr:hypothetical protein EDB86DRAFT_2985916 [Lactarius hatsudake]